MPDPTIRHASKANLITIVQGLKALYTNQDAFAKVKVGATTTPASDKQDTFEIAAGANISVSIDGKVVTVTGDYDVVTQLADGLMSAADKVKLDGIEDEAQVNVIESVKVNGNTLTIDSKAVDVLIAEGATNGTVKANGVDIPVHGLDNAAYKDVETTLADDGRLPTGAAVKAYVDSTLASVYKPAGSSAFSSLPTPIEAELGNVYNVTDAFFTTSDFVEGAGNEYGPGTNVVVISVPAHYAPTEDTTAIEGKTYYADGSGTELDPAPAADADITGLDYYEYVAEAFKFDVLPGFIDLSAYALTADIGALTAAEVQEILDEA